MTRNTMTIRKDKDGKIRSVTASGDYARNLFNSFSPVTVNIKPEQEKDKND